MREDEAAHAGFTGHLSTLASVQVHGIWPAGRERTVQHGEIRIPAEPHERGAILRIARVGERSALVFHPVAETMQAGHMEHGGGNDLRGSDADGTIARSR